MRVLIMATLSDSLSHLEAFSPSDSAQTLQALLCLLVTIREELQVVHDGGNLLLLGAGHEGVVVPIGL